MYEDAYDGRRHGGALFLCDAAKSDLRRIAPVRRIARGLARRLSSFIYFHNIFYRRGIVAKR